MEAGAVQSNFIDHRFEVGLQRWLFKGNNCCFLLALTRPTLGLEGLPLSAKGTLSCIRSW